MDKLKHWGIKIHDEITESEFFNEVFMVRVIEWYKVLRGVGEASTPRGKEG